LAVALWLNVGLATGLLAGGLVAASSGLTANALDNTSDAMVYGLSYFAVKRGAAWRKRAAQVSGVMLLILAGGVLLDVGRRVFEGGEPIGVAMVVITLIAAGVNLACLKLLHRVRSGNVNLRAAWTFSINDLLANVGVLVAGLLVAWLGQAWPDLVVGVVIALVAGKGGVEILMDANRTERAGGA
jgi:Co/Zn/Cd efflux system component